MADYSLSLSYNNQEEGFFFPVLPSEITVSGKGDSASQEVYGLGKINVIKSPALEEYAFESFFPARDYSFVTVDHLFSPDWYIAKINKWRASGHPVRLLYVSPVKEINAAVSIEQFDWNEAAGGSGDIQFSLKLKEYRFYSALKAKFVNGEKVQKKAAQRQNERQAPKTYTLKAGDNLWKVSQKIYGTPDRWKEIQKLNKLADADLKRLQIGRVLKLPAERGGALA